MKKSLEILERLKEYYGVGTYSELSKAWGVPMGTLDTWKNNDKIPNARLIKLSVAEGLELDWIKNGTSPKYTAPKIPEPSLLTPELVEQLSKVAESMPIYGKDKRTKTLCKKFDDLDDVKKRAIYEKLIAIINNV